MKNILNEEVLVLNSLYIPVGVVHVPAAINRLFKGSCTPIFYEGPGNYYPLSLKDWMELPIHEKDLVIHAPKRKMRVPTIILACHYDDIPRATPTLDNRSVRERDRDTCQYTGLKVPSGQGNIDHVIPKKKGGQNKWTNMVYTFSEINALKKDKLPHEVIYKGKPLQLIRQPKEPLPVPRFLKIHKRADRPEWDAFALH